MACPHCPHFQSKDMENQHQHSLGDWIEKYCWLWLSDMTEGMDDGGQYGDPRRKGRQFIKLHRNYCYPLPLPPPRTRLPLLLCYHNNHHHGQFYRFTAFFAIITHFFFLILIPPLLVDTLPSSIQQDFWRIKLSPSLLIQPLPTDIHGDDKFMSLNSL